MVEKTVLQKLHEAKENIYLVVRESVASETAQMFHEAADCIAQQAEEIERLNDTVKYLDAENDKLQGHVNELKALLTSDQEKGGE